MFCDIDGVLADCSHRLHYLNEKDYDKFYSEEEMLKDGAIREGIKLWNTLFTSSIDCALIFVTGRPYRTEKWTREWLKRYANCYNAEFATMLMRKDHDYRPSDIVKVETINKFLEENPYRKEKLFIDDDPKNVKAVEKGVENCQGILFGTSRL